MKNTHSYAVSDLISLLSELPEDMAIEVLNNGSWGPNTEFTPVREVKVTRNDKGRDVLLIN